MARVGGTPIMRSALEARMAVLAATKPTAEDVVPVPPSFTGCIAHVEGSTGSPGAARPSAAAARARCRELYGSLVSKALQGLISAVWVKGWAGELGVHVSVQQVRHELERTLALQFPTEAKLREFLTESRETIPDLLFHQQERTLEEGIRAKINREIGPATSAMISRYYAENLTQYHVGEQRDLEIVRTKKGKAVAAGLRRELERGVGYSKIAKRLEGEQLPYIHDGVLENLEQNALAETPLNKAIFSARTGVLTGPVHLQAYPRFTGANARDIRNVEGYYLFTVTKIVPAHVTPLAQVKSTLLEDVPIFLEKRKVRALVARLRPKWRAMTDCAPGYVVLKCRGYRPVPGEPPEDPYTLD